MVTVEKAVIAKIDKGGKHFEVLVDPEIAYDLKNGKIVSVSRMLAINQVFTDSKKGMRSSSADLEKLFGTTDSEKISEEIVKKGDVQITAEFRRKKAEERRKQIVDFISKFSIDPRSKLPHPPERIMNAMEQSHVKIDPFKTAEQQVDDVVKAIREVLPVSFEELNLHIEVLAQYGSRVYGVMKEFGSFTDQWSGDKLIIKIRIPAGLREKLYRMLNNVTEGTVKIQEEKK